MKIMKLREEYIKRTQKKGRPLTDEEIHEVAFESSFFDIKTIEDKYERLRTQIIWAVNHYGLTKTDGIIDILRKTIIELDKY
jgi:hypothetical protein